MSKTAFAGLAILMLYRAGLFPELAVLSMSALVITVSDQSIPYGSRRVSGETVNIIINITKICPNFDIKFNKIQLTER